MKFYISSVSNHYYAKDKITSKAEIVGYDEWDIPIYGIEINSLEELIELKNEVANSIIIGETYNNRDYSKYEIEIYDGYRE